MYQDVWFILYHWREKLHLHRRDHAGFTEESRAEREVHARPLNPAPPLRYVAAFLLISGDYVQLVASAVSYSIANNNGIDFGNK